MQLSLCPRLYALLTLIYVYNVAAAPLSNAIQNSFHGGEHPERSVNVYPRGRSSRTTTSIHIPEGYPGSVHITTSSGGSSDRPPRPPRRSSTATGSSGWHDSSYHDAEAIPGVRYTSGNPPPSYRPVHNDPPSFQRRPSQSGPPPSGFRYSMPSRPGPPPRSDYRDNPSRYPPSASDTRPGPPPPNFRPQSSRYEPPPSPPPYRPVPEYESPPASPIQPPRRSHTTSFDTDKEREKEREREMEKLLRPWGGKMPHAPSPPPAA